MKKLAFHAVNDWKPLSILERIWWLNYHFIIKKNKRLDKRLWKANHESLFNYKIEGNYFKGKIWVLYKLKAKTSGEG